MMQTMLAMLVFMSIGPQNGRYKEPFHHLSRVYEFHKSTKEGHHDSREPHCKL